MKAKKPPVIPESAGDALAQKLREETLLVKLIVQSQPLFATIKEFSLETHTLSAKEKEATLHLQVAVTAMKNAILALKPDPRE